MRGARSAIRVIGMAAALAAEGIVASPAAASSFTCEASALRAAVLSTPRVEPVTANRGGATCAPVTATLAGGLPEPLSLGAAAAQTTFTGSDAEPAGQAAGAIGGVLDATVRPLGLPRVEIPADRIPALTVTLLPSAPDPLGLLPPQEVAVDLGPALQALVSQVTADVLRVGAAAAFATAKCADGRPSITGSAQLDGLSVFGQELPIDAPVDRPLTVLEAQAIDPSDIDVTRIPLPAGVAPELLPVIQQAAKPLLDGLAPVAVPATVGHVRATPRQTIRDGDRLTQRALGIQISLLGRPLVDAVLGEATVSAGDLRCTPAGSPPAEQPPAPGKRPAAKRPPAAEQPPAPGEQAVADDQLQCTTRRLALVDVLRRGRRVRLLGVADRALVGRRVAIRLTATGRVVARPVVGPTGEFSASAPLPPASIRDTGRARYQAVVGSERSMRLKLARRMVVTQLSSADGKVTIAGRVVRPLGRPVRPIVVSRRVSCRRQEVVARIRPSRSGAFRVTVDAPPRSLAAVYRLSTRVRKSARNPKLFPTFTLPRAVEIR